MDCIFCKIVKGDIPSTKVYEDEHVYAFDDIQPLAPVHVIVVPKRHYATLNNLDDREIWFAMLKAAQEIARIKGIDEKGYRIAVNCGPDGTQIVMHLHLHVLGGRQLDSKMG
ncbi:MAG TPA: histidine triad nucleotide-binding protein [Deltaproteobacteria bacterium]|nr:histidine triad nucleotide-binding protein [Deltaproteobacteria bacterium]HPR55507.1 histidine triad nucleotide-binding protein [Deltaproteobacteria bacterium]HXK48620.1 histidine triad nucleotide-binding protein [Deltaproteobacteria bacterium]